MNGWKFFPSYSGACGAFGRDGVKVNAVSFVYYQAVDGIYAMPLSETEAAREALTPVSENAFYDSEAVAWALGKLEAFGCQTKIESAMMMDRLKLMLLGTPPSARGLKDGWIPLSERRPEGNGDVIVANGGHVSTRGASWVRVLWDESVRESISCALSHWQPLPEAPK